MVLTPNFLEYLSLCEISYKQGGKGVQGKKVKLKSKYVPRTQKAKGIMELVSTAHGGRITNTGLNTLTFILIQSIEDFETQQADIDYFFATNIVFARPCPMVPRHGFLDSTKVRNKGEAIELFKEMVKIDEQGEMILMPYVNASHNGVITSTIASFGIGHDGATSGNKALTLPVHGTLKYGASETSIKGESYLETVYSVDYNGNYAVQLRDGPMLPRTKDIIPESFTVDEIIDVDEFEPKGDLLAWELLDLILADRNNGKDKASKAVHLDGPIGSHFASIVLRKIPFMTTRKPNLGSISKRLLMLTLLTIDKSRKA
jgi:hypothetical protein